MAIHNLYHAGDKPTNNVGFSMWPASDIDEHSQTGPSAAHRGHTSHQAISRCIDFRPVVNSGIRKPYANQDDLVQWFHRTDIAVDDVLSVVVIPPFEDFRTIYYRVNNPVEGLVVDLVEVLQDTVIEAGIDLGVEGGFGLFPVADADRMKDVNRIIGLKIKTRPEPVETECNPAEDPLAGMSVCVSAEVVMPWTGR